MTSVLFLDTTILIASFVHPPKIKSHIRKVLSEHSILLSGLVVKQEFCRRFLKEAVYLLSDLKRRNYSFDAVFDHVTTGLPPQQNRKKNICLRMLRQCYSEESDSDRANRLQFFLEDILENGLNELRESHITFLSNSQCKNGMFTPRKKRTAWEFSPNRCDKDCQIGNFLYGCNNRQSLFDSLSLEKGLTPELQDSLQFLGKLDGNVEVSTLDPCLKVGDLVIALECKASGATSFFTQNVKESQVLCPALGLNLIVCPTNQDKC